MADLASNWHGVVSSRQLERLGYSRRRISREAAAGRLHRLHRGVYAVGHLALTPQARCFAAVLAGGEGALLSHQSAAWLWGISNRFPPVPHVTAAAVRHSRSDLCLHSAATLHPDDVAEEERIPMTAVPRTLLDLAGSDRRSLRWALPRAKRLGLLDVIAIDAMLARSPGMRGARRLRSAIERYRVSAFTRSDLELDFLALVERAGLPRPSTNIFESGFELDAFWPELRFVVELDTYDYHGDEISFEEDRLRQEELKLVGIEMTRITGRRMEREPAAVAAQLRRLLAQRRQQLGPAR